jgi:hypothetical protein
MLTLPELSSLKPEDDSLEQLLILILKLGYNISETDAVRVHQFSVSMFQQGCAEGAKIVLEALQTNQVLRAIASASSSESIN